MEKARLPQVIQAFPCFAHVPLPAWSNNEIYVERFSPRLVMDEGHLFAHAAFVLEGKVRIHKISESGREITLYRVTRGGVCVLMMASILGELEYAASAELEEETELLLLPVKVFKQWLDEYKDVRQFIYSTMIKRMASVTTLMENIAFKPIDYRLAKFLLSCTTESDNQLLITHEAIAIELGTAREVVSRSLKEFESAGWIKLGRGRITNIDRTSLANHLKHL
ncbi:Crp/Fnr family transcriptional regulator [Brevibacillus sp. FSL K6-0770]|uniref:Crp/Fnr family transcriptional regulator n=1 Tax=Brevibacillus sp. FSL K6-0770 TaxID=2954673 RepID=UPI0030FCCA39